MKNIDPRTNPVTTILGAMLCMVSLVMFAAPMFVTVKETLNYWIPGSIGFVGLCLLLIPDDFKGWLSKIGSRKSEQI